MKILIINAGSSSIKYQLFDMENNRLIAKGLCQKIGEGNSSVEHKVDKNTYTIKQDIKDHAEGLGLILEALTNKTYGVVKTIEEINGFGHRYVHGGTKYQDPIIVTKAILKDLKTMIELAPLHNPANIMGIEACMKIAPKVPNVAVFDTGFYKNLPLKTKLYPINYELYEKYGVQKFGFHGISHDYVSDIVAKQMGKLRSELKIITCHIGNGASISAIDKGTCIDTSMGFTPLEGIMMGTRSGDVDPAIIPYLMKKMNISADEVISIFNKKSGIYGISGLSNDTRDILANLDNPRAKLSLDMYVYRIKKYICAYAGALGGADAIVFTAGVGENSYEIREMVMSDMSFMGVDFDFLANKNFQRGKISKISTAKSKVDVWIIPTDEEFMIAKQTIRFLNN